MFAPTKQSFQEYSAQLAIARNFFLTENAKWQPSLDAIIEAEKELTEATNEVEKIRGMLVAAEKRHWDAKRLVSLAKTKSRRIHIDTTEALISRDNIAKHVKALGKMVGFMEEIDKIHALIVSTELPLITSLKSEETAESKKALLLLECIPIELVTHIGEFIKPALKLWDEDNRHIRTARILYERFDMPDFDVLKYVRADPLGYGFNDFRINKKSISYLKVGDLTRHKVILGKGLNEETIHNIRNTVIRKGVSFVKRFIRSYHQ